MRRIIRNSGGWQSANETQVALRAQLTKKKRDIALQIERITTAIAQGGSFKSLLGTLQRLEQEQDEVCRSLCTIEQEIEQATLKRPTPKQVQQSWGVILQVWDTLPEDERTEVMGGLVKRVDVTGKDRVLLELSPVVEVHGLHALSPPPSAHRAGGLAIKSRYGTLIVPRTRATKTRPSSASDSFAPPCFLPAVPHRNPRGVQLCVSVSSFPGRFNRAKSN